MKCSEFVFLLQQELRRHDFSTFVDEPPPMAHGGKGIVVPGCVCCRLRLNTTRAFLDHLWFEVLPRAVEKILATANTKESAMR